jgi:hypothetical protein
MDSNDKKHFPNALVYLFKETFEGSPPQGSVYLDKGVGIFSSIEDLSAENASQAVAGASIAAHTDHLRYYLDVLNNFVNGNVHIADWSRSWKIGEVGEEEWTAIKEKLHKSFETVGNTFSEKKEWGEDGMIEAIAMVAHTAYHLGAIRQIIKEVTRDTL